MRAGDSIHHALINAYERDYTHLTVVDGDSRALLGYVSMPQLKSRLQAGAVREDDLVETAMLRFRRRGKVYRIITMDTPLEELEEFFRAQDFAVVTDVKRRFVLGVATKTDLAEFVRRRPD